MTARRRASVAGAVALALGAAGCPLFSESLPDRSCRDDFDCFRAQGEVCNPMTKTCETAADAAPMPDAPRQPDASPAADAAPAPDAAPADAPAADAPPADAAPIDAGVPDA